MSDSSRISEAICHESKISNVGFGNGCKHTPGGSSWISEPEIYDDWFESESAKRVRFVFKNVRLHLNRHASHQDIFSVHIVVNNIELFVHDCSRNQISLDQTHRSFFRMWVLIPHAGSFYKFCVDCGTASFTILLTLYQTCVVCRVESA